MNIANLKLSLISAAALALSASSSFAQMNGKVSVRVPFEFTAGPTSLPAGDYSFTEDRSGVMYISSAGRHKAIVVLTNPAPGGSGMENASVTFDKVNGQYALTSINMLGEPAHRLIRTDEKASASGMHFGVTNAVAKSLR